VSGLTPLAARDGGKALLTTTSDNTVHHVVTRDLTRLSRDPATIGALTDAWTGAGVRLHVVDGGRGPQSGS
jgi:hypothetical protein